MHSSRSAKSTEVQRFVTAHASFHNLYNLGRQLIQRGQAHVGQIAARSSCGIGSLNPSQFAFERRCCPLPDSCFHGYPQ